MAADVLHSDNTVNRPDERLIADAYHHLYTSTLTIERLRENALNGTLCPQKFEFGDFGVVGRSLTWKTFLIPVPPLTAELSTRPAPPLDEVRKGRERYVATLREYMQAPDGNYEDGFTLPGQSRPPTPTPSQISDRNNPLSLDEQNPWKQWFLNMDMRKTIKQDVQRTFPDLDYFREPQVQYDLTNILYIQAVANPNVGYRQGMHELLASIYLAVDSDSLDRWTSSVQEQDILDICDRTWVPADAWILFEVLMQSMNIWYEWKEPAPVDRQESEGGIHPYVAPIVTACNRIQNQHLSNVDPTLWRRMSELGVEPQLYGMRWLRLLFTREFGFRESLLLWDGIFAVDATLGIAQWICVAMLVRIRNKLIPSDYSEQLTYLLHYPTEANEGQKSLHISVLLQQAVRLSQDPNTSTGASIVLQNRNILGIPIEVPERPAKLNTRKRGDARMAHTARLLSSEKRDTSVLSSSFPEIPASIARNILERGESLGINRAFFSTVSEIRKNLPDIPTAFTRQASFSTNLPFLQNSSRSGSSWDINDVGDGNANNININSSGNNSNNDSNDNLDASERQDYRSGLEAEMNAMRSQQKTLAQAVSWAVDAILQDSESLPPRKREAIECLAYVRDVLMVGRPTRLDIDRLVSHHSNQTYQTYNPPLSVASQVQTLPQPQSVSQSDTPSNNPNNNSGTNTGAPTATTKASSTPADVLGIGPNVMLSKRDTKPVQGLTRIPHSHSHSTSGLSRGIPTGTGTNTNTSTGAYLTNPATAVPLPISPLSPLSPRDGLGIPTPTSTSMFSTTTRNRYSQPPSSAPSTITSRFLSNYSADDSTPSQSSSTTTPTPRFHGRAQSHTVTSGTKEQKPLQTPSTDPLGVLR